VLRGEDVGLGGRILVALAPRNQQANPPWTRLTVGSPVILSTEGLAQTESWRGVISRLNRNSLEVALNQSPEPATQPDTFRVDAAYDEIARQRMQQALTRAAAAQGNRTAVIRQVVLGQRAPEFARHPPAIDYGRLAHLNPSQQEAVRHALAAEDVAIIHGPPGTGKTTTVAALIVTAVSQGSRVLACAPSNLAVDNLAQQLAAAGIPLARLGHPIRVLPELLPFTLDALVEKQDNYKLAKRLRKEAYGLRGQADKFRRAQPAAGSKQAMREEARELLDEARQLEMLAVESVLDQARVILSTLTAVDSAILGQRHFDLCVVDEAGQSTEPATWIPITRANKLVLAGDHQQLPPTVLSLPAEREGFGISLLEQLMRQTDTDLARRLDVQYRMHTEIMNFSAAEFYDATLKADLSVAHHLLYEIQAVTRSVLTETAVTFIDTAGAGYDERQTDGTPSRSNPQEAALAAQKAHDLLAAGLPGESIAVIAPYAAQVNLLREILPEQIEVGSVDGLQGREKEAVIISLVRSNPKGDVGFLAETRRMNVALTRARRKLIVIGDSATVTAHPFYARLIDYFEAIGAYHSVWDEFI
nr:AAA family ATPase [Chloroflexota bacterium]